MQETTQTVAVKVNGNASAEWPVGTRVSEVLGSQAASGAPFVAALYNHDVVGLGDRVDINGVLQGLTAGDDHGWRVFQRSMGFLLAMAAHRRFPSSGFRIHHSVGPGLFCTLNVARNGHNGTISAEVLSELADDMRALVAADLPVRTVRIGYIEAVRLFEGCGLRDKLNLLRHRNAPTVDLQACDGFFDLHQGTLVDRTGLLDLFQLIPYESGFVLHMPSQDDPARLPDFAPQPHLLRVYQEHIEWGRILGVQTAGQLNEAIYAKRIHEVIQMAEALHDKKLAQIAGQIAGHASTVRLVLIAGPSSAGKTTTAKRLSTHLRINGLRPVVLGTDDYFVGEERNPRDADGKPDYEHIEALDLDALNADLDALLQGRSVRRRVFDFRTKSPTYAEEQISLGPDGVLVMEGLHGLNPRLTRQVPRDRKFLVYLSALTQLGLDENNRVSTTDNRLIRRIVRDNQFRGHTALRTMRLWSSVRRGEERWIFPFQHLADATFNSSLDYELAVLKPYVEPLLTDIKPDMPEYTDARRLMGFLNNFYAIPPDAVPGDSILREYIGDSQLQY